MHVVKVRYPGFEHCQPVVVSVHRLRKRAEDKAERLRSAVATVDVEECESRYAVRTPGFRE